MVILSLSRSPEVKAKLDEEVEKYIQKDGDITTENMNKMVYLKAVIK